MNRVAQLEEALKLALEYWAHRQQRYKNRHPQWVQKARAALAERQPEAAPEGWRTDIQNAPKEGFFLIRKYDDHYKTKVVSTGYFERETANAYIDCYEGAWWELCDAVKGESLMIDGPLEDCGYEWKPLIPIPAGAVASEAEEASGDPLAQFEAEFMAHGTVKSSREWWAWREICTLRSKLEEVQAHSSRDAGLEEAAEICDALYGRHNEWATTTSKTVKTKADRAEMKGRADAAQFLAHRIRGRKSTPAPASAQDELVKALTFFVDARTKAIDRLQQFLDTFGDLGDRNTSAEMSDWLGFKSPASTDFTDLEKFIRKHLSATGGAK